MEEKEFQTMLISRTAEAEEVLKKYLPLVTGYQHRLLEAMEYSLLAGGKRLRPVLMKAAYDVFGGKGNMVEPFMAALEMIHTYSLVHDDLPAMDNDTLRRGKETTWKVYGEAGGILAGDALLNYAFETALKAYAICDEADISDEMRLFRYQAITRAMNVLARKAGVYGMIGGQTVDVESEKAARALTAEELLFVHENKTAALIQAALMIGAILAGADEAQTESMEQCGYDIGIAFQIQDDILDVEGSTLELGKNAGSDEANGKQTYVTVHGMDKAREDAEKYSVEAAKIAGQLPGNHAFLEQLILSLIGRKK